MPVGNEDSRPAGEGDSHTARVYVAEESDSGILPMNRPNNGGPPLAEGEEGRPLIKENTHQSRTHPTQSGARVSQRLVGVRPAEYRLAATYPRQEPYALMSARTDLCGGCRATGIPTATGWRRTRMLTASQRRLLICQRSITYGASTCTSDHVGKVPYRTARNAPWPLPGTGHIGKCPVHRLRL